MSHILENEHAIYAEATQLLEDGQQEAARTLLQQLVDVGTVNADVFNDLGAIHFAMGDADSAILMLKIAADLNFSSTLPLRNLVSACLAIGQIGEALAALALIAQRDGIDDNITATCTAILTGSKPNLIDLNWLSPKIQTMGQELDRLRRENERLNIQVASLNDQVKALKAEQQPPTAEDIHDYCRAEAGRHAVLADVHPEDFIFGFFITHPQFAKEPLVAVSRYFESGAMSAQKLRDVIFNELRYTPDRPVHLLEFASGYGCVTRHLVKLKTNIDVVACDIHPEAMHFISKNLGVTCLQSEKVPEQFPNAEQFDIVFALSFFSHMPDSTWGRWLAALFRNVKPSGCLLFTTHGHASMRQLGNPTLSEDGFWFKPTSEQHDLEGAEYGSTITSPAYVKRQIGKLDHAALELSHEAFWWGHQDFWAVRKLPT